MKLDKAAVARIKNATPKKQQKGASSLEYIMLAAVLVGILVFLNTDNSLSETVKTFFTNIFAKATGESGTGG